MKSMDIEQMLRDSDELTPSPELNSKALIAAKQAMTRRAYAACREERRKVSIATVLLSRRGVAFAVCLLLVFGVTASVLGISNETFRIVYVDVNPSVALHVNRFERVCEVEYLNEDAQRLLSGVKLNRCTVEDALEIIIDACTASGYMDGEAELYISAKDGDALIERLEDCAVQKSEGQYSVNTTRFTDEEQELARPHGISPGKYRQIIAILTADPTYTIEQLANKPMRELKAILSQIDHNDVSPSDKTTNEDQNGSTDTDCDPDQNNDNCNGSCTGGGNGNGNGHK